MYFYLKVSSYIRYYLLSKYGADVIVFPEYSTPSVIITTAAVQNSSRCRMGSSYCRLAVEEARSSAVRHTSRDLPPDDDLGDLIPIALPETLLRGGRYVRPSADWQLSLRGSIRLREELKHEFWCDLMIYVRDCYIRHAHSSDTSQFNRLATIEDFLIIHSIPCDMLETIDRTYRREKSRILDHLHTHTTTSYSLP